jgi:hypothetical protein
MVTLRFSDAETKRCPLGFLTGRFLLPPGFGREVLVPDAALPALAQEGFSFTHAAPGDIRVNRIETSWCE